MIKIFTDMNFTYFKLHYSALVIMMSIVYLTGCFEKWSLVLMV